MIDIEYPKNYTNAKAAHAMFIAVTFINSVAGFVANEVP